MGCDIHFIIEQYDSAQNVWFAIYISDHQLNLGSKRDTPPEYCRLLDRDYDWFGRLAGVRTRGPDALGIPDNASFATKYIYDSNHDLHSWTYMPFEDFLLSRIASHADSTDVANKLEGNTDKIIDRYFPSFYADYYLNHLTTRAIIYFDN